MKQNSGASGSADRSAKRMSAVEALPLLNDDSEEDELDLEIDYSDSELREAENVDLDNISVSDQSESDVDLYLDQSDPSGGQQRGGVALELDLDKHVQFQSLKFSPRYIRVSGS